MLPLSVAVLKRSVTESLRVDAALFQWFTAVRAQSVPISGEILKAKAEDINKEFDQLDLWTSLVDG